MRISSFERFNFTLKNDQSKQQNGLEIILQDWDLQRFSCQIATSEMFSVSCKFCSSIGDLTVLINPCLIISLNFPSLTIKILFWKNQISKGEGRRSFSTILISAQWDFYLVKEAAYVNTQEASSRYKKNYRIKNLPFERDFINIIIWYFFLLGLSPQPLRFPLGPNTIIICSASKVASNNGKE